LSGVRITSDRPLGHEWLSGWKANERPAFSELLVRYADSIWHRGFRSDFEYRDLGLGQASGDLLRAQHARRVGVGKAGYDWHCHDNDFQVNYALSGSTRVENKHNGDYTLTRGDCIYEPGLYQVREYDFSEDYACIQISSPTDRRETILGRDTPLPDRAQTLDPDRRSIYTTDRSELYAQDSANVLFRRSDLATAVPTDGRIGLSVVRAARLPADANREYHTTAQWLVVLQGTAEVRAQGRPVQALEALDAISFGAQRAPRIVVQTPDFAALEMHVGVGIA
jgi:quercetin dioxygenase-like cupin family protein